MTHDQPVLLLMESDAEVLRVAPPFMQRVGEVYTCQDIVGASEVLNSKRVSLLVVANRLLVRHGVEVLHVLRHRQPCAQVMVFVDQNATEVPASVLAEGIGDVVVKPFDVAGLPRRIEHLLDVMKEQLRRAKHQRELEARMRHHDRVALLGTLVATVAHEIANPLSVVTTNAGLMAEVLNRSAHLNDEDHEFLLLGTTETLASAAVIKDYLSRVLRFSRNEKRATWDEDLGETLRMALLFVRSRAQTYSTHVHVAPLDELPKVSHHASAFAQAVVNALTNAIDAAGPNGNVWLHVEDTPSDVTVVVQDDGPGLSEDQKRHSFEAFHTTKENGTGLGTLVIRQVLAEHGGSAEWVNREEANGEVVRLRLPKRPSMAPMSKRFVST